jgi:protein-S-isoprenylcysteine O-methyltransferase Ste14
VTHGERLAAELRHAWNGDPWHGPSVAKILTHLTAREAARRRTRGSHTPWELLRHLTTWAEAPLRRFDDAAFNPPEALDFPAPVDESEEQWQRDVAALGDAVERLAQRVAPLSDVELETAVADRGYSYRLMVDGVLQHLAYHGGQLALLARTVDAPKVLMPAPVYSMAAIGVAEALTSIRAWRLPLPRLLAFPVLAASLLLAAWAILRFVQMRTTTIPWRRARVLVVDGPYRLTRNPMYASLLLLQLGLGIKWSNSWYLATLALAWYAIDRLVVRREEPFLLRHFGEPYRRLLDTTPRWFF